MTREITIQNYHPSFFLHEISFGKDAEAVYCNAEFASIFKDVRQIKNEKRLWVSVCTYKICAPAGAKVIIGNRVFLVTENELTPVLDHPKNNSNLDMPCTVGFKKPYTSRWQLSLEIARKMGRVIEIDCGGNCPVSAILKTQKQYESPEYELYFFEFVHKYEKTAKIGSGLDEYYVTYKEKDVLNTMNWADLISYR